MESLVLLGQPSLAPRGNPTAKIIVFDPKDKFSKQTLFEEGWRQHYSGMIEWVGGYFGKVERVDPAAMEVIVDGEATRADACNVIPAMKAGRIAEIAGLTADNGWCPIVPASMQSAMDPNVWVLGDATIAGDMSKSGFSANS